MFPYERMTSAELDTPRKGVGIKRRGWEGGGEEKGSLLITNVICFLE